ncbi:nucleotide sugar dehydrogenase [Alkalicoccobacillus porphyridii]|uniref:Nucleotide sugar dehydrogenase n=1 Tax=Alkalicoccobacillus porphyridii TaxID=2597270 RepID=A0A553ZX98_9BACI|nr:nucleotide sugar dehydrogenase [Alkalicoccobacillus porphyridii]TSB46079.1 nucleotide sugar dehydrogenase [Alkalicoccobacillus porphyridii]
MAFTVAVIGLGYVGLPLATLFHENDFNVIGIDVDLNKMESLKKGISYLSDITDADILQLTSSEKFSYSDSFQALVGADAIVLCVPTPLRNHQYPDLSYLESAVKGMLPHLQRDQLIVLESSTFPGTTEEVLVPLVESSGFIVGKDIFLGYSPERIDPGNKDYSLENIPKVISGVTKKCLQKTELIYSKAFRKLVPVGSPRSAEMTKILENTQRLINISFINEMSQLCHQLDIDIWEVIQAASTKPYGFTPYFPGPGIGGHCIPVDPLYLKWKANLLSLETPFIDLAKKVNDNQPNYIISRTTSILKDKEHPNILLVGLTYKKDVNDVRESVSIPIFEKMIEKGWDVQYTDPFIKEYVVKGKKYQSINMTEEKISEFDVILILTDHSMMNYDDLIQHSKQILDTRNCIKETYKNVIRL